MFTKKVVVAYNDTDLSNDVLDYVHEILGMHAEIELDIVYAYEHPLENPSPFQRNYDDGAPEMLAYAEQIIQKAKGRFTDLPNHVEGFVYDTGPASAILSHAHDHGADLIVIGSRGTRGLRELVSSVSRTIQTKSHIPVLTFPKFVQEEFEEQYHK